MDRIPAVMELPDAPLQDGDREALIAAGLFFMKHFPWVEPCIGPRLREAVKARRRVLEERRAGRN